MTCETYTKGTNKEFNQRIKGGGRLGIPKVQKIKY